MKCAFRKKTKKISISVNVKKLIQPNRLKIKHLKSMEYL